MLVPHALSLQLLYQHCSRGLSWLLVAAQERTQEAFALAEYCNALPGDETSERCWKAVRYADISHVHLCSSPCLIMHASSVTGALCTVRSCCHCICDMCATACRYFEERKSEAEEGCIIEEGDEREWGSAQCTNLERLEDFVRQFVGQGAHAHVRQDAARPGSSR